MKWFAQEGKRKLPLFFLGVIALGSLFHLLRSPSVRYPDNADYWRVMHAAGVYYDQDRTTLWLGSPKWEQLMSSASLATLVASIPARLISPRRGWDIRWQALLYWCLYVGLLLWAGRRGDPPWVLVALSVVVFDPVWILHTASFRSETPMHLALLACLLLLPAGKTGWPALLAFAAFGTLAKTQYVLFPLGLALIFPFTGLGKGAGRGYRIASLVGLFGLAYVTLVQGALPVARQMAEVNRYNRVFNGPAFASQRPRAQLANLGIAPAYWQNAGRTFLSKVFSDSRLNAQLEEVSYAKLAWAYLSDWPALKAVGGNTQMALAQYTLPAPEFSWFSASAWLVALSRSVPAYPALFFLLGLAAIVLIRKQSASPLVLGLVFLGITALVQVPVVILGDGFVGLVRHLSLVQYSLQLSLAWAAGWWLTSAKIF